MHNAAAQRTPLHAHANQFSVTRSLNFGLASFFSDSKHQNYFKWEINLFIKLRGQ